MEFADRVGVKSPGLLKNERILTCGQRALVCGPTLEECRKRYDLLLNGGFVVPGPNDEIAVVATYEKALEMRKKYSPRVPASHKLKDFAASTIMWHQYYGGLEPGSIIGGFIYNGKLKKASREKINGRGGP